VLGNTAQIIVRPLVETDEADWRRLWTAHLRSRDTKINIAVYQSTFAWLMCGEDQEFHGLIAEMDGKPVGLTHYFFHRNAWKTNNVCYLQDLYADPDTRGMGVGRALLDAVHKTANENGYSSVLWQNCDTKATAPQFHDEIAKLSPFLNYERI